MAETCLKLGKQKRGAAGRVEAGPACWGPEHPRKMQGVSVGIEATTWEKGKAQ